MKNVSLIVHKAAIKYWLNDSAQPMGSVVKKMLNEDGLETIRSIALKDEVYMIQFFADVFSNEDKKCHSIQRYFITDLESIEDITYLVVWTELSGCRTDLIKEYPEEINDIISHYLFGDGWDNTVPIREYWLELWKRWSSKIMHARTACEEIYSWKNQACQYPESGEGIQYFKGKWDDNRWVDCLLSYDDDKTLQGILNYYSFEFRYQKEGDVNIYVREDKRRSGIATSLLDEARLKYEINLDEQNCNPLGKKFFDAYVKRME